VGGAEARRGKPSRLEAIAHALHVSVATANLSVVSAILSFMSKYGAVIPAAAAGIILALSIAAGALSAWALGKHRLHGHFLGSYALALTSVADKASHEGILLTTILPIIYIAGIAQSITEYHGAGSRSGAPPAYTSTLQPEQWTPLNASPTPQ